MDSVDGSESNLMQMLNSVVCEIRNDWDMGIVVRRMAIEFNIFIFVFQFKTET